LKTEELVVSALAVDADGVVYAAGVPGGRIYRIGAAAGEAKVQLPDPYIWALAFDRDGNLLAATGPNGKLYRVEKGGGWVKEVFQSDRDKNLISLLVDPAGDIYCGTAENGILYRVRTDGKVEAVFNFKEREVRALALSPEGLLVGTNVPKKEFNQVAFVGGLSGTLASEQWGPGGSRQDVMQKIAGAALYRIDATGRVDELASFEKTFLLGVGAGADGGAFVATGDSGRVFSVDRDRRVATAIDLEEDQVLCLAMGEGFPVALGAGSPAAVHAVARARGAQGQFTSKVLDAKFAAAWGRAEWAGQGDLAFWFRSGHTEKPDRTWSDWRGPVKASGEPVPCPRGRYLQMRVDFGGAEPAAELARFRLAYAAQNQRPVVREFAVGQARPGDTFPLSIPKAEPAVKLRVKADDPDGDRLVYRFFYRVEGGTLWVPVLPDPTDKPEVDWNTDSLPDGTYLVRVEASDESTNTDALTAERVSRPLVVDHGKPRVEDFTLGGGAVPEVHGTAADDASPVTQIDVQIDEEEWRAVPPEDRVCDSRKESFSFTLPGLASGLHRVKVRVWDSAGNSGIEAAEFRVP
jgi:hypothetical protein